MILRSPTPVTPRVTPPRTRRPRGGALPLRAYLVLKYLRAVLAPDSPAPLSNAAICAGVGYGSEGEVSQILRWLGGEQPLAGRWAHRYLDTPQRLRYLRRERRPDGGYTTTLLATPEPLVCADAAPLRAPEAPPREHHHPPTHDPIHDLRPSAPECATTEQMQHDPPPDPPATASHRPIPTVGGDHAMDSESNQLQQQQRARATRDDSHIQLDGAAFVPWAAIKRANPGFTLTDLRAADANIRTRMEYDREQQLRVLFASLLQGQKVYSQSEIAARRTPRKHPPNDPPRRERCTPADPHERWRHIAPVVISAEDAARTEQRAALARQLAPPDAEPLDVVFLLEQLEAGATEAEALTRLSDHHAAEACQPSSDEVYRELTARSRRAAFSH